jgi:hypothetical protein
MLFIEFPAFTKAVTKCPMMTPSFNMSLFPIPNKEPSFGVQAGSQSPNGLPERRRREEWGCARHLPISRSSKSSSS